MSDIGVAGEAREAPGAESTDEGKSVVSDQDWPRPEAIEHLGLDTGFVLEKGELELNIIGRHVVLEDRSLTTYSLELQLGLLERLMLELELPYEETRFDDKGGDASGIPAIEVGAKIALWEREQQSLAFVAEVEVPLENSGSEPGSDPLEFETTLAWSRYLGAGTESLHIELGTEWEEAEGLELAFWKAGLDAHGGGTRSVYFQQALSVSVADSSTRVALLPGIQFAPSSSDLKLGLGASVGLTPLGEDWGFTLNLEVEFD